MGPDRKTSRKKILALENIPTFCVLVVLSCGMFLFGADARASSLVISMLTLVCVLVSVLVFRDVKFSSLVNFMLVVWIVFTALSFKTGRTIGAEDEYLMLMSAIGVFGLGQYAGQNSNRLKSALWLFLVLGFLFSTLAFLQHIVIPDTVLGLQKPYHRARLTGPFLSSNTTATFLGLVFLMSLSNFSRSWRVQASSSNSVGAVLFFEVLEKTSLAAVVCLFSVICLLLTASRTGIASTALSATVFGVWILMQQVLNHRGDMQSHLWGKVLFVTVFAVLAVYFWNLSGGLASTRYENVFSDFKYRSKMIEASWQAFLLEPWFGHGLGSLEQAKFLLTTPENNVAVDSMKAVHNVFLQWLLQVGILGVAVFSGIYIYILAKVFHGALRARRYKTYCLAILCVSLLVGLHGLFDYAVEIPVVMLTYAWVLGIGHGISIRYVRSNANRI